ncbi:thioredoxin [Halobacteriales archaeon QS_4_62_28]|nr:MAG: thioredoxin [Halobacteriales archaeon QS_4_62_28]
MDRWTRRGFLATTGGTLAALTGCAGAENSDAPFDHASTMGIADQPTLGSLDRSGVIVAFEDPSCTTCRRFNQNTFPQIEADLVESGDAAYVFRGYPIIYPWGDPASHALEATLDRDPRAMWALKTHYFDTQDQFSTENVLDRTAQFLTDETEVDGTAVVNDVESDAYADTVQVDLDAGEAAGASSTPTFYLFRDGEYQTTVSGAQDFTVFENVLRG